MKELKDSKDPGAWEKMIELNKYYAKKLESQKTIILNNMNMRVKMLLNTMMKDGAVIKQFSQEEI